MALSQHQVDVVKILIAIGTVNPKNNLAHCFSCNKNFNNIDLMLAQGHDFMPAVDILKSWLEVYLRDLGRPSPAVQSVAD